MDAIIVDVFYFIYRDGFSLGIYVIMVIVFVPIYLFTSLTLVRIRSIRVPLYSVLLCI